MIGPRLHGGLGAWLWLAVGLLAGCSQNDLFIDLRTDFAPPQLASVTTRLVLAGGGEREFVHFCHLDEDHFQGVRIAELSGVPDGEHRVEVTLHDRQDVRFWLKP